ncbi:sigma-70 family RNA polymerase sigma factor [Flavihumibacter sp. CACIAM 22H1]|uniref:RNA polymerase sigma factor n=1 Tax=Flavihumibacter sp. CACIAM 22H1 TaxID=1812911 RepID=UPI000AD13537|nr:sigma-70 family RNA polymerase sigma factor [Flavihumibacter sp. CACIAM 22H1]
MKNELLNTPSPDYQQCWIDFRSDQETGLYTLYNHEYDRLYRYGMLSSQDPHLVKSAINSTFLDLWVRRAQLPEVENVKGYLFICFKRQLFQTLRKEQGRPLQLQDGSPVLLSEASFEDALIGHELDERRKIRIKKALACLSERQRQFIQQRFFEDMNYEEIAEQSNTSVRTVYNTIHAAINRLRAELGDADLLVILLLAGLPIKF